MNYANITMLALSVSFVTMSFGMQQSKEEGIEDQRSAKAAVVAYVQQQQYGFLELNAFPHSRNSFDEVVPVVYAKDGKREIFPHQR